MADTFTPRGAPVPANSYDGWELTNRPAMLPFLAEYTNALGEKSGGWAMPSMVTEPVNALSRLLNTPAGTMPDPRDSQNQSDALTGLMALYGGNALGGVARNAMSRGIAMGRPNMEAARPVAYSNGIDAAMSNPNMLSMMRDIDYANLNRRALEEYGVGYEGLTSSQEAKLRGWSDPALWSDTGKPNPVGAALSSNNANFKFSEKGLHVQNIGPAEITYGVNPGNKTAELTLLRVPEKERGKGAARAALDSFVKEADANGYTITLNADPLGKGGLSKPALERFYQSAGFVRNKGKNKDFTTRAEYIRPPKLLSDTGKPNPLGAALASQDPDNTNALAELLKRYGVY